MKFEINPIKPCMTHEQKVYEYARRISHYSLVASSERTKSKIFDCQNLERNFKLFNEMCGCMKHGADAAHSVCEPCKKASRHYTKFRDAVSKKAAALRQLNKEMQKCQTTTH